MNNELKYKNNPLNGIGLKQLVTELVNHYGFEILYAYLNINCFKANPSIDSSVKFLKKTEWAREKVELFYLYKFKNLPKASSTQFKLPPRDRIIPDHQTPGEPAELSLEDAEQLREKQAKKAAAWKPEGRRPGKKPSTKRSRPSEHISSDRPQQSKPESNSTPWGNWKGSKN